MARMVIGRIDDFDDFDDLDEDVCPFTGRPRPYDGRGPRFHGRGFVRRGPPVGSLPLPLVVSSNMATVQARGDEVGFVLIPLATTAVKAGAAINKAIKKEQAKKKAAGGGELTIEEKRAVRKKILADLKAKGQDTWGKVRSVFRRRGAQAEATNTDADPPALTTLATSTSTPTSTSGMLVIGKLKGGQVAKSLLLGPLARVGRGRKQRKAAFEAGADAAAEAAADAYEADGEGAYVDDESAGVLGTPVVTREYTPDGTLACIVYPDAQGQMPTVEYTPEGSQHYYGRIRASERMDLTSMQFVVSHPDDDVRPPLDLSLLPAPQPDPPVQMRAQSQPAARGRRGRAGGSSGRIVLGRIELRDTDGAACNTGALVPLHEIGALTTLGRVVTPLRAGSDALVDSDGYTVRLER
jgi:hypothetical protein